MFKKFINITGELTWTLVGSFIVIITLSGSTQALAIKASLIAVLVHYSYCYMKDE